MHGQKGVDFEPWCRSPFWTWVLHKAPFDEMLEEFWDVFPQTRKLIRRAVLKLGLKQARLEAS
jgi:hypothetical protein